MTYAPSLPPELWLQIFRIASASRDTERLEYAPFTDTHFYKADSRVLSSNANTRLALVLVCKQWRSLANELLYEEIRTLTPKDNLKDALGREGKGTELEQDVKEGYGKLVRFLELPRDYDYTFGVLKHCPRLQTLLVTSPSFKQFASAPAYLPSLIPTQVPYQVMSSLQRIDWRSDSIKTPARFDYLEDLIRRAPNLRYLSIIGEDHYTAPRMSFPITLPKLETLYISELKSNYRLENVIAKWSLPSLRHLVLDRLSPLAQKGLRAIWHAFGASVSTVELGTRFFFFEPTVDHISDILSTCTSLTELCLDTIHLIPPIIISNAASSSLTTIRVYHDTEPINDRVDIWEGLEDILQNLEIPSLRRIVLHGDWTLLSTDRLLRCGDLLQGCRCSIYLENGKKLDSSILSEFHDSV